MKRVSYIIFILCLASISGLKAQQFCKSILDKANDAATGLKKDYPRAISFLQDMEVCDKKGVYLKERNVLLNKIFSDINAKMEELDKNNIALNAVITMLKNNTKREVNTLIDDIKSFQYSNPSAALEKIKNAAALIKIAPSFGKKPDMVDTLSQQYEQLVEEVGTTIQNSFRQHLHAQEFGKALALLPLIEQPILAIPSSTIAQLQQDAQTQIQKSIEQDMEVSNYLKALEKNHLLGQSPTLGSQRPCVYFELAFCLTITQQHDQAMLALDSLKKYLPAQVLPLWDQYNTAEAKQKNTLIRQMMEQSLPDCAELIIQRYFPNHFEVIPAGNTSIEGKKQTIDGFALAKKELSFFEYDLFYLATKRKQPVDNGWGRGNKPVIDVNWYDALLYCNWRSLLEGRSPVYRFALKIDQSSKKRDNRFSVNEYFDLLFKNVNTSKSMVDINIEINKEANGYRLPTELEWQFAAGNGTKNTKFSWGDSLLTDQQVGNLYDTAVKEKLPVFISTTTYQDDYPFTAPTGSFPPNELKLYDMSGNVWEWCWDERSGKRAIRGGAWSAYLSDAEVNRPMYEPAEKKNFSIGFRLAKNN